jgi:hypothetical protein
MRHSFAHDFDDDPARGDFDVDLDTQPGIRIQFNVDDGDIGFRRIGLDGYTSRGFVQRWASTRSLGPVITFIALLIGKTARGLSTKFRLNLRTTGSLLS